MPLVRSIFMENVTRTLNDSQVGLVVVTAAVGALGDSVALDSWAQFVVRTLRKFL